MSKVNRQEILEILNGYDKENMTIATLGSHSSLHMFQGAKAEGFRTAVVCEKGREVPYQRFGVVDEYIMVDKFSDIINDDVQEQLKDMNSVVFPHGSFVAYAGLDNIETIFNVPMFGNRDILRWEAERDLERKLMIESGIRIPKKISDPGKIDGTVMVKFPGARGGKGYFAATSPEEFDQKIKQVYEELLAKETQEEVPFETFQTFIQNYSALTSHTAVNIREPSIEKGIGRIVAEVIDGSADLGDL